jgi:pimeloyl-ACP methyl ester carboxylesterase
MTLHYETIGNGPPLVILHGLYGSSDNWKTMGKKLSTACEVIMVDLRNHGKSPHDDRMEFADMSNDILEFAETHLTGKFFILGHSMGGKTAMEFANHYPQLVKGLIIVDIAPKKYHYASDSEKKTHQNILKSLLELDLSAYTTIKEVEESLTVAIQSKHVARFLLKNLFRDKHNQLQWRINLSAIEKHFQHIFEYVPPVSVQAIFPVLFLKGALSDYITTDDLNLITRMYPSAGLVEIPSAGHWLHAEQPVLFYNEVMRFLNRHIQ